MSKKAVVMYLKNGQMAVGIYDGAELISEAQFALEGDHSEEIAAMAEGAEMLICPGGCLKPLKAGIYALSDAAVNDARDNRYGRADYNLVMEQCGSAAKRLNVPAYFTEAMSVDELLPLNKIRSHAKVPKYSRGFRAEHLAAARTALAPGRIEDGNYIIAYVDDLVSVGAYSRGKCLDINDCIGAEGPMGLRSSGDVPCAQLANYFAKQPGDYLSLQDELLYRSGLLQYLGTADPAKIDELCQNDKDGGKVLDSMAYQIAKWIGSSALVLKGDVQGILFAGKACRSQQLTERLVKKVERIAPVTLVPDENIAAWLAEQAMLLGSFCAEVQTY